MVIGTADKHAKMMDILYTPTKVPIKRIGVLLYDGYNTLDAVGPYHTLSEIMGAKTFFVAKKRGFVKNMNGMEIKVDSSFADIKSLDILVLIEEYLNINMLESFLRLWVSIWIDQAQKLMQFLRILLIYQMPLDFH